MRFETALYLSLPLLSQVYANPFPQNNGGNGANNGDPQQSLTLDPKCTMVGASNHQPPLVAVAQRGTVDDCIYMQSVGNGAVDTNSTSATPPTVSADPAATDNGGSSTAVDPSSTSSTPPAAGSDAAKNGGNNAVVNPSPIASTPASSNNGNKKNSKRADNSPTLRWRLAYRDTALASPNEGDNNRADTIPISQGKLVGGALIA